MEASVEVRLRSVEERLDQLETRFAVAGTDPVPLPPRVPAPRPTPAPETPSPDAPAAPVDEEPSFLGGGFDLEEMLGGRVLGWVGGISIVLGVVFFLALAINRGWIDEPTRVALAFLGSSVLFGVALWLHERHGRTQASLAAMGAAIAALYASDTAATALYDLLPSEVGLALAGAIGLTAGGVAVRWRSPVVAGIGIVGALLAPVLVDAGPSGASLAFLTVAVIAAVGVLLWQRWGWLAGITFVVSLPQLIDWVYSTRDNHQGRDLVVIAAYWLLYLVAAIGHDVRVPTERLRIHSALLLFSNTSAAAAIGWLVLHDAGNDVGAKCWLLGLAAVNVVLGAVALRARLSPELGSLVVGVGAALAALAFAVVLDGPALVAAWVAAAMVFSYLSRRIEGGRGHLVAGVFLALAAGHALGMEVQPRALAVGVDSIPQASAALGLVIIAAAFCAFNALTEEDDRLHPEPLLQWGRLLVGTAAVAALYLASVIVVDLAGATEASGHTQTSQLALSAFWTITGVAALVYGLVDDRRVLRLGGFALLGIAVGKVFVVDLAALESVYRVGSLLALGLLLLTGAFAYQRARVHTR